MNKLYLLILISFVLAQCKTNTHLGIAKSDNIRLETVYSRDTAIQTMIAPYKTELDAQMNRVIGYSVKELTKAKPESTLGNWCADLVKQKVEEYTNKSIDFCVLNYGGLRIPALPAGDISVGKIYELMPFDNLLVAIEMKGSELLDLFNRVAGDGGWPLSKEIRLKVHNGQAVDGTINGEKLAPNQTYLIATTDYLANGGDKCTFFINKEQIATDIMMRDAMIEFVEEQTAKGAKLDANIEGRIFLMK